MKSMFMGKVSVVTGASGGIGKTLSQKLSTLGSIVYALDENPASFEELTGQAKKSGKTIHTREVDVTDTGAVSMILEEIAKKHQRIDIWMNNAGVAGIGDFEKMAPAIFERINEINFLSVSRLTRKALEFMQKQGSGTIVNMASVAGHVPAPFMSAYCASKHAVVGFTRSLQEELRLKNSPVRLMLVSPGFVDTPLIAKGETFGFPTWLSWMLSTPETVTEEILKGLIRKKEEICPTRNGRWMLHIHSVLPKQTRRSAKVLFTRKFSDIFLHRYRA